MTIDVRRDAAALPLGTAICMGAFDGLHRGHQALIDRARTHGSSVALLTFDPHPAAVIAPDRVPTLLYGATQRARAAEALGVSALVLLPFDRAMSKLDPHAFVQRYLIDGLRPTAVVVGADFRFGAGRAGTATMLRELLAPASIDVDIVQPIPLPGHENAKLSSTDVRRALDRGDVTTAGRMLGRWHALAGIVGHGAKRGRTLGFPTANLTEVHGYVPPLGVYATALSVWNDEAPDHGALWPAVTNVGRNPTFNDEDDAPIIVETHVLDRSLDERLYDAHVEVAFIARLRDEAKFDSAEALVKQMHHDAAQARSRVDADALRFALAPRTSKATS